jgi:DNA-directed RNA polymerase
MEINNAVKSEDPSSFLSNFPIHQDGSCNGLQHYAALGRDEKGAFSVNLSDSNRPQDVYSDIADLVELKRKEDEKTEETARILNGFIGRKVIKQTVMTTVYNVTMYGAKLQILRQLEMLEKFPKAHLKKASQYLAKSTFQNLNEVFESARKIQQWLSDCAYAITKLRGHSVIWVTPLGLIVVQPYYDKNVRVS